MKKFLLYIATMPLVKYIPRKWIPWEVYHTCYMPWDVIVTRTLRKMRPLFYDNVCRGNPLLARLMENEKTYEERIQSTQGHA